MTSGTGQPASPAGRRWADYVLARSTDSSAGLWSEASAVAGRTVLVCGVGFDPRTLDVATRADEALGQALSVLALELPGSGQESVIGGLAGVNRAALAARFGSRLTVVPAVAVEDASAAGPRLTRLLVAKHNLLEQPHLLVDMSAMPSSMSFPLLRMLLTQSAPGASPMFAGQLQVVVSESPDTDARIRPSGLDEPSTLGGFARLPDGSATRIWVPVLGERRGEQLLAIQEFLEPGEVCPVLPFPARAARRADDLLLEHRELLFDRLALEPSNVLYASEQNPFDLYRQLCELSERYRRALAPLGGAAIVVSQHASKLLSLGVLLAAQDADLVVAHVRPTAYDMAEGPVRPGPDGPPVLHTAWLAGAPYDL